MYLNPYESLKNKNGKWLKANFHTHTSLDECGTQSIEKVIGAYEEAGYDVLTISSHDSYTDTKAFKKNYNIKLINGYEHSQVAHMCCIGVSDVSKGNTHQEVIDECINEGGIVIMSHPNWDGQKYGYTLPHWSWAKLEELQNYTGIEICNQGLVKDGGGMLATDAWDNLLSKGKFVWGFANDDMHLWEDFANAWNMIFTTSDSHETILSSIQNGAFYASTGLYLKEFEFDREEKILKVSANLYSGNSNKNDYLFIGENGKLLHKETGPSAEYKFSNNELYVRVEVRNECGSILWTQPLCKIVG